MSRTGAAAACVSLVARRGAADREPATGGESWAKVPLSTARRRRPAVAAEDRLSPHGQRRPVESTVAPPASAWRRSCASGAKTLTRTLVEENGKSLPDGTGRDRTAP